MTTLILARLTNRKLLKIFGPDCYPYLQGLLSNDLRYLYEPERIPKRKYVKSSPSVLSSFMLNAQGRAICDMLLYRTPSTRHECKFSPPGQETEQDELFIECDAALANGVANTLYGYRVRRKISLAMENEQSVWCLFPQINIDESTSNDLISHHEGEKHQLQTCEFSEILEDQLILVGDPRLTSLGLRVITRIDSFDNLKRKLQSTVNANIIEGSLRDYTLYRFFLGIGEGVKDHPESNCLPLECNADYLNSVSFDKGCYLGQELTARIHHTGVVRKRLMPIQLNLESGCKESGAAPLANGTEIVDKENGKKIGILRRVVKNRALALLRTDLVARKNPDETQRQIIHDGSKVEISTYVPYWWR